MGPGKEGESTVCIFFGLIDNTNIVPYENCFIVIGSSEMHSIVGS